MAIQITTTLIKESFQRLIDIETISDPPTTSQLNVMKDIIYRHSISQALFYTFAHVFFNRIPSEPGFPALLKLNATEIIAALKGKDIEDIVTINISSTLDNMDLDFEPNIPPIPDLTLADPTQINYSVGLLYGLATIYPTSKFLFCKAKKYDSQTDTMKNTAVFAIQLGVHNVYFGDLSDIEP